MAQLSVYTDRELIRRISSGDESAFKYLFESFHPKIYSYLFQLTGSKEQAEDILHDVFLKIWSSRSSLPEIDNINAYLYSSARNKSFDAFRRHARESLALSSFANLPAETIEDPEDKIIYKQVRECIQDAVSRLTPQQRQVYLLSREKGLKQEEIASQMGISILTVKRHLTDALNFIRREVSRNYPAYGLVLFLMHDIYIH